jgi:hypothetical protein
MRPAQGCPVAKSADDDQPIQPDSAEWRHLGAKWTEVAVKLMSLVLHPVASQRRATTRKRRC